MRRDVFSVHYSEVVRKPVEMKVNNIVDSINLAAACSFGGWQEYCEGMQRSKRIVAALAVIIVVFDIARHSALLDDRAFNDIHQEIDNALYCDTIYKLIKSNIYHAP